MSDIFNRIRQGGLPGLPGLGGGEQQHKDDDIRSRNSFSGSEQERDRMYRFLLLTATQTGCEITHYEYVEGESSTVALHYEVVGRSKNIERFRTTIASWNSRTS